MSRAGREALTEQSQPVTLTPEGFLEGVAERFGATNDAVLTFIATQELYNSTVRRAENALGLGVTANEALALELEALIEQTPEFSETLRELAGSLREADAAAEQLAAERERQQQIRDTVSAINAATNATTGFVDSLRQLSSGNTAGGISGLFGAAGGIAGLFGPKGQLVGAILGSIGSIIGSLFGRRDASNANLESRAAGAAARGAPSVEFNVTQNNSIAVNGIPELRGALADAVDDLARVIESNLIPRIQRLEGSA